MNRRPWRENLPNAVTTVLLVGLARQINAMSDPDHAKTARSNGSQIVKELCNCHESRQGEKNQKLLALYLLQSKGDLTGPDAPSLDGYQRRKGGTDGGAKQIFENKNLYFIRVSSHHSIDPSPPYRKSPTLISWAFFCLKTQ